MMNILEIKDLKKIYKIQSEDGKSEEEIEILKGINLSINSGEYVSIVGPSGSGKSTLMQIIGLLDNSFEGSVRFLGRQISEMSDDEISDLRRNYIGFVFQSFNLLSKTTALDNVNLPLLYSRRGDKNKAARLLDMVGLSDRKKNKPNQLSGGQQQRVAIARALVNDPKIIFADEPTGNISQAQSQEVMDYFSKLNAEGVTIVLVTHDPKVATQAKRVITIVDGRIESDVDNSNYKNENSTEDIVINNDNKKIKSSNRFLNFFKSLSLIFNFSFVKENILEAIKSLRTNKFRTFLSLLGIAIGVASVITIISLGQGSKENIEKEYENFGTKTLVVQHNWRMVKYYGSKSLTTIRDYELIKDLQKDYPIEGVSRWNSWGGTLKASYLDKKIDLSGKHLTFSVIDSAYFKINKFKLLIGSFFTEKQEKNRENVCVIGPKIYKTLFNEGVNPIGKKISLSRISSDNGRNVEVRSLFKVVGVIDTSGDLGEAFFIPYSSANGRFLKHEGELVTGILVGVKRSEDVDNVKEIIFKKLHQLRGIEDFESLDEKLRYIRVENMGNFRDQAAKISDTFNKLLVLIACISLLVGGIGIMNIMIVSVEERTKEIGLRKALGARKLDVLFQFIVEAIVIGGLGGGIGAVLGVMISLILSIWLASIISWNMVVISFSFSFVVALIFGFLPARQASKLSPVEALRSE